MKSMTGYGKAQCELPERKITVEVKTLNSKQTDISIKAPYNIRDREPNIRSMISKYLERGKIDLYISSEQTDTGQGLSISTGLAERYLEEIREFCRNTGTPLPNDIISTIIRLPDVISTEPSEISEDGWLQLQQCIETALQATNNFREQEGKTIQDDIQHRINIISAKIPEISQIEAVRTDRIRNRLSAGLSQFLDSENIDKNRFEQELIYYLEKWDFSEEKSRLMKHCNYFNECMNEQESNGKKLTFITQEIGRELNTLGSKANDADIQRIIVEMKDELEKIKEQLYNVL